MDVTTPQYAKLPGGWQDKLSSFQRLLVLRAFRPEKLVFGVRKFIGDELGELFTEVGSRWRRGIASSLHS